MVGRFRSPIEPSVPQLSKCTLIPGLSNVDYITDQTGLGGGGGGGRGAKAKVHSTFWVVGGVGEVGGWCVLGGGLGKVGWVVSVWIRSVGLSGMY